MCVAFFFPLYCNNSSTTVCSFMSSTSQLTQATAEKVPQLFFSAAQEVGGGGGCAGRMQLPPVVCVNVMYYKWVLCQHLSGSISEHSVSMSESYSEWPVGSLTGDCGACGVRVCEVCECVVSSEVSVQE